MANSCHCQRYVPKLSARRNFTGEVSERGRVSQERKHFPRWISLTSSERCVSGLTFYDIPSVRIVTWNSFQVAPTRRYAREELWTSAVFFRRQRSERGDGYLASCEFEASSSSGRCIRGVTAERYRFTVSAFVRAQSPLGSFERRLGAGKFIFQASWDYLRRLHFNLFR